MCKNILRHLELTLAILKPDVCRNPFIVHEIKELILQNNFYVVQSRTTNLSIHEAENFYEEHKRKFFFNRLTTFMSSGSISVHVLARENAIKHWRSMMGPTRAFQALYDEPNSIRGRFGLSDTRNATHGSDSPSSALREIVFFFPEFDAEKWYENESRLYTTSQVELDPERFIHKIKSVVAQ